MTGMADIVVTVERQLRERLAVIDEQIARHDALRTEGDIIRRMLDTVPAQNGARFRAAKGEMQQAILEYFTTDTDKTLAPDYRAIEWVVAKFAPLSHAKDPERAVRTSIAALVKAGKLTNDDGDLRVPA